MPLYNKNNEQLVFHVHIPKTGGSSVTRMFEENGWVQDSRFGSIKNHQQHAMHNLWNQVLGDNIPKFSVIREPIQRIISEMRGNGKWYKTLINPWDPNKCVEYIFNKQLFRSDNHFRKLIEFVDYNKIDEENLKIFRYEDNWTEQIKNEYGLEGDFPHIVGDLYSPEMDFNLSEKTVKMIKDYYIEDYKLFYPEKL